jgi:glycosyltransferase involved in cell wall biosynthesis
MKVLMFSELFYPHGGGAELATWLYAELLAQNGFEVTVITRQFPNEPSSELLHEKVKVYRYPLRFVNGSRYVTFMNANVVASRSVNKIISDSDLVYLPGGWYSAIPFAKAHKKTVVVHMHNNFLACPTSLMYNFDKRRIGTSTGKSFMLHEMIQKGSRGASVFASCFVNEVFGQHLGRLPVSADALVFVSKAQMEMALTHYPWIKGKSHMVYNPIPHYPLIESESIGIGYFGGKNYVKGYSSLVEAVFKLHPKSNTQLHMAMTSPLIRKRVLENGVEIIFYPKLTREEILKLMRNLSVVVVPSLNPEPFPYALIEAMLCGKVVVASNSGGIPEIVDGAGAGAKLVKPEATDELAEALSFTLELGSEDAQRLGNKNRELVLHKFTNDTAVKSFIKVLDSVD